MAGTRWSVEVLRASPEALHARPLPEPAGRTVWVCEPTVDALVLGSAQPDADVDRAACARAGVQVARRRSGGGAVRVGPGRQLWVDVLLPAGDELWSDDVGHAFLWLGEAWAGALADVGVAAEVHRGPLLANDWSRAVCFAGVGPGEVLDPAGAKLVGLSQRRTRGAARFQCAVLRSWDPDDVLGLLQLEAPRRRAAAGALATAARGLGPALDTLQDALLRRLP